MKWDSSFAIGIEAIDDQHRKIFEYLLAIESSAAKRDPAHILRFFVTQLSDYMKFHLAVEESLLEIIGYPDFVHHRESHAGLLEQIATLQDRLEQAGAGRNGGGNSAENLVGFFENWFVRHVLSADRDYAAYIEEKFPALMSRPARRTNR